MALKYKEINVLKNLPFYSEEIKSSKKGTKNLVISNFYMNYHSFLKNWVIFNYQKRFHSFQKDQKGPEN